MRDDKRVSRRSFLGAAAAAISAGAGAMPGAFGQSAAEMRKGKGNHSAQNPGAANQPLVEENPDSVMPPDTDHGDIPPFWYSFDLAHRRIQDGGWTRQVTERDLPVSREMAGVNMRLTAGSYRELHWHTANEWAYMLYGNARVTVLNPDGTIFIGDVGNGDLWYFPAGHPHSLQGLGPDGCEFLLVFDEGNFSEYQTFTLSDWLLRTPREVLEKSMRLPEDVVAKFPKEELYIFPGTLPGPVEDDRMAVGGKSVQSKVDYTFRMLAMKPNKSSASGDVRVVDSTVFPPSRAIASALVTIKPGALREMHWHPNSSEWQYWVKGRGRMTVFTSSGKARTMDFKANDVGYVPIVAGHYVENTGTEDLVYLATFKSSYYADFSLNQWLRRVPPGLVKDHLNLEEKEWRMIPGGDAEVVGR